MSRQLHVYLDGTWNNPDLATNVLKLFRQVKGQEQRVADSASVREHLHRHHDEVEAFYLVGVGAQGEHKGVMEGALGLGLHRRVMDAYVLLSQHYRPGDKIWLFGFSRGAWSARALAGLVGRAGLLPAEVAHSPQAQEEAEHIWMDSKASRASEVIRRGNAFWAAQGDDKPIRMVGVWDTVGALGVPFFNGLRSIDALEKKIFDFADLKLGDRVELGRHALAIDEKRFDFAPTLWQAREGIQQVWFAGAHADVGGGYNETGLSDIALRWMAEEALAAQARIDPLPPTLVGDPCALKHDETQKLQWQLRPIEPRQISLDAVLHPSVMARLDRMSTYRPDALCTLPSVASFFSLQLTGEHEPVITTPQGKDWRSLAVGETKEDLWVFTEKWWNATLLLVRKGERYRVTASGEVFDASIPSGPDGYPSGARWQLKLMERTRRVRDANWFCLIACVHDNKALEARNADTHNMFMGAAEAWQHGLSHEDETSQLVPVGAKGEFVADRDGYLFLFVNDTGFAYSNNLGKLTADITRLA